MRLLIALVLSCLPFSPAFAAAPPARVPPEILKLIEQLGGETDARKQAERKLAAMGEDVVPLLDRAARTHADPDVRFRATLLVAAMEKDLYGLARSFPAHANGAIAFVLSPDSKRVATCAGWKINDPVVRVWDVQTGKLVLGLKGHAAAIYALAWSKDGKRLFSGDLNGVLILWNAESGKRMKILSAADPVNSVALTPDNKRAVSSGTGQAISIWDLETGKAVATNTDHGKGGVRTVQMLPDGKRFVTAGLDGTIRLIDVETGKEIRQLAPLHSKGAQLAVPSEDGKRIASAGIEGNVFVCDVETGKQLQEFSGHDGGVHALALSRDGRRLITGGYDQTLRVWDVGSGKEIQRFEDAHAELVTCVALLPGERTVLTSGYDRPLKVWKIRK